MLNYQKVVQGFCRNPGFPPGTPSQGQDPGTPDPGTPDSRNRPQDGAPDLPPIFQNSPISLAACSRMLIFATFYKGFWRILDFWVGRIKYRGAWWTDFRENSHPHLWNALAHPIWKKVVKKIFSAENNFRAGCTKTNRLFAFHGDWWTYVKWSERIWKQISSKFHLRTQIVPGSGF